MLTTAPLDTAQADAAQADTEPTTSAVTISRAPLSRSEVAELNARLEGSHPSEIIRWAVERFGTGLCMTTSFSDTLLIDLATSVDPDIEVIFRIASSSDRTPSSRT